MIRKILLLVGSGSIILICALAVFGIVIFFSELDHQEQKSDEMRLDEIILYPQNEFLVALIRTRGEERASHLISLFENSDRPYLLASEIQRPSERSLKHYVVFCLIALLLLAFFIFRQHAIKNRNSNQPLIQPD